MSTEEQDLKEFIVSNIEEDKNGCWIWQKHIQHDGYGVFDLQSASDDRREFLSTVNIYNKTSIQTHKLSHLLFNGPLSLETPLALHTCSNRACCNPHHVYAGTAKQNTADMMSSGKCSNRSKYKRRPKEVIEEVKTHIRAGYSSYATAKRYGMFISSVWRMAKRMKNNGEIFATRLTI